MQKRRIVIVGGGFVGVKCALELSRASLEGVQIRLITDKSNFEYHGALYRLVVGKSPMEVCLPLRNILDESRVEIITDKAVAIDKDNQVVTGQSGSTYNYDELVLGLGAETNYFGIPGLEEHAWGMKTIDDALRLQRHITGTLQLCPSQDLQQQTNMLRFVVVGAGPTGVELAGELAGYVRQLVGQNNLDPSLVQVALVERSDRILPKLNERLAKGITKQLEKIGVDVMVNTSIESLSNGSVVLSGETIGSETVIWTAGVKANELMGQLETEQDRMGRAIVDEYMNISGYENIYIGGDVAATPYSGMAQTAINDGQYLAQAIIRKITEPDAVARIYSQSEPVYAIPAGAAWSGTQLGKINLYGKLGWIVRRWVDWKVFYNFLPLNQAWAAFRSHYHVQDETVC